MLLRILLLAVAVSLVGCASPKAEIGRSVTVAKAAAMETKATIAAAMQTGDVGPAAMGLLKGIPAQQDIIIKAADGITDTWLPGVEDKENWFQKLVHWWPLLAVGAIVLLVVMVLSYLGLAPLAARFVGGLVLAFPRFLSWLIPPRIHSEAKLDYEALNGGGHSLMEQSIAGKRFSRAAYNAAFIRVKRQAAG